MPDYIRTAGNTDVSVVVFIFNPTTGLPDTTVVPGAGLVLEYRREGAASVAITETALGASRPHIRTTAFCILVMVTTASTYLTLRWQRG